MPTKVRPSAPAVAYSYIRFSTADQINGDSRRRQTEAAAAWAERNGVKLDESTKYHDLGKSAFTGSHRLNPDRNKLALFLKLVEEGKVPRGSYLVIESLDRLSREHIQPALLLVLNLLQSGIRVVQLQPAEMVYDDKSDTLPVMMMMMELSRGYSESCVKSERIGSAWEDKRKAARQGEPQPAKRTNRVNGMSILTHRLPAWLEEKDGRPQLIPARAAAVKRIFQLAAQTHGHRAIVKLLKAENIAPFGNDRQRKHKTPAAWTLTYIHELLTDRRALGEYQPTDNGEPDGPAIPNYYPPAVTEREYYAARAGSAQRRCTPGRIGRHVSNLFAGLIHDLRDGGSYWVSSRLNRNSEGNRVAQRLLFNGHSKAAQAPAVTFVYRTFERAVLAMLTRVDPDEVFGQNERPAAIAQVLRGELDHHAHRIAEFTAELANGGPVAALADLLRKEEARVKEITSQLGEMNEQDAKPLADSLRDLQEIARSTPTGRRIRYSEITQPGRLLAALDAIPDDEQEAVRLKLRAHLRRVIDRIHLLVTSKGRTRFASVQIVFAAPVGQKAPTKYLDLVVVHQAAHSNGKGPTRPGRWYVLSNGLRQLGTPLAPPAAGSTLSQDELDRRLAALPFDAKVAVDPSIQADLLPEERAAFVADPHTWHSEEIAARPS